MKKPIRSAHTIHCDIIIIRQYTGCNIEKMVSFKFFQSLIQEWVGSLETSFPEWGKIAKVACGVVLC